jgi:septin family protein
MLDLVTSTEENHYEAYRLAQMVILLGAGDKVEHVRADQ